MERRKSLLVVALIAGIFFFVGFFVENQLLKLLSKPIPVIILALLMPRENKFQKYIFYGFVFSVLGDILLELPYDLFLFGLLAFLLAHVSFILGFLNRKKSVEGIAAIVLLIIGTVIFVFLFPELGEMKIAVAVYMLVILTMVWRAFAQRKVDKYAVFAFGGAISFLFSDTNIAFDKFYQHYEFSTVVIMITYWLGQYLIFLGAEKSTLMEK